MGDGTTIRDELDRTSRDVWERTRERLRDLGDVEYLWEPAPGCWSLRERADGGWRIDLVFPAPAPAPFTTLAWRIAHLVQCYGQRRNGLMLGVDDGSPDVPWRERSSGSATEALAALDQSHERWSGVLAQLDDQALLQPIGSVGGPYAADSRMAFVLHMLDEVIHHGAEAAMLRDLYVAMSTPARPPTTVAEAAAQGRWNDVVELVEGGASIDNRSGPTALHLAASAGEAEVLELLVAHGGDLTVRDPTFDIDVPGWARYFGHHDLADRLER